MKGYDLYPINWRGSWELGDVKDKLSRERKRVRTSRTKLILRGRVCNTSQDVRLEIERTPKCALHSCIENLGNFRAFNKTNQSDRGFACVNGNRVSHRHECDKFRHDLCCSSQIEGETI
jgi:hypothetical protein